MYIASFVRVLGSSTLGVAVLLLVGGCGGVEDRSWDEGDVHRWSGDLRLVAPAIDARKLVMVNRSSANQPLPLCRSVRGLDLSGDIAVESHPRVGDLVIVMVDGAATCVDHTAVVEAYILQDQRKISGEVPDDEVNHDPGEQEEPDPLGDDPMPVVRTMKTGDVSNDPVLSHTEPTALEDRDGTTLAAVAQN